jgi:Fe-S cluster assembly protein SufD
VTIGKVDEEQIFYLLSRGIPRNEAERLIVEGFFDPILQRISLNEARQKFQQAIQDKMTAYKK